MRHPKNHIDYQRRQQVWFTAAFTAVLIFLIWLVSGCTPKTNTQVFSQPKWDVSTRPHSRDGKPAVRDRYHKRYWFWQKGRELNDERMREHGPRPK
ncbi:MAG TPA: hypothetical protein PLB89_04705 [Flavobacteriales bacterium]|nr:hypothetical protein [Flavobacteriales bacterium]